MARERDAKVRAELRKVADVVQREVDAGATTVEEIHKAIARMPLDALEKLDVFEQTAKDVRRVQDASIGAVYDVIRKVNDEVAKFARQLLAERSPKTGTSAKARTAAAKRPASRTRTTHPSARA